MNSQKTKTSERGRAFILSERPPGGTSHMQGYYRTLGRAFRRVPMKAAAMAVIAACALAAPASAQVTVGNAFPTGVHARAIAFTQVGADEYQLIGTHSFGVYRSVPGAIGKNRWLEVNTGLVMPLVVNDIEVLANGQVLLGVSGRGGLYRSVDNGSTWSRIPSANFDTLAVNSVQAIAQSTVDNLIYLSADDGNVFYSQDGGTNWRFNGRLPGGSSDTPWALVAHPTLAKTVYAGTFGRGIYYSTDNGGLWTTFTDNSTLTKVNATTGTSINGAGYVFDLEFDPTNANRLYAGTSSGVWRFENVTNLSGTWARVATADSTFNLVSGEVVNLYPEVRSIDIDAAGRLFAATWGFGVMTIADPKTASASNQIGLREAQVSVVSISPGGTIYAGTGSGVFEVGTTTATGVEPAGIPGSYALSQNYPNPFNPETTVSFDIPRSENVRLGVYDLLGRRVALMADGVYPAGSHSVTLDATGLPSGMYLYRLETASGTLVRSMTLLK